MSACLYHRYLLLAATLDDGPDVAAPQCLLPPTHTAIMCAEPLGLKTQVDVPVCTAHDVILAEDPAHQRSIRLRQALLL
jgi:hypothetical protein